VQVKSGLRPNQTVRFRNRTFSVQQYFERYPGVSQTIRIRGGREVRALIGSARLYVGAHDKKRFVIALNYAGEKDHRYLLASDLTWRTQDIVQAFTWRWLVEVFVQDWKTYEGWGALTHILQCAVERRGSSVGESPTRQLSLQPVAIGAVVEATKQLKPSITGH
jgi:hypothetical protein